MSTSDYGFLNPVGLSTVLLVFLTMVLFIRGKTRSRLILQSFHHRFKPEQDLRPIVILLISTLMTFAIIRPYWGVEDVKTEMRGDDVIFLVDISRSMYAQDLPPSRLELAKRKIKDLIQSLSLAGTTARFGISVFSGDGYTVCPVTTDRGVLTQFIEVISPELVTSMGSNLKAGLDAAISRLDDSTKRHSRIILISDGEDQFLNQASIIKEISASGVRLDILGIGSLQGGAIQLPSGGTVLDAGGKQVISTLNEDSLKAIASAASGIYVRATLDDQDIAALSKKTPTNNANEALQSKEIRVYREIGPWICMIALVTLIFLAAFHRSNPLLFISFVSLSQLWLSPCMAQERGRDSLNGFQSGPFDAYQRGEYATAEEQYRRELQKNPQDRNLQQGLASSLFKQKKFQESYDVFQALNNSARDGRSYFESAYNSGTALLGLGRYQDAIDSFSKALDVKPEDPQATHNLGVARALLAAAQNKPTPTPTPPSNQPSANETPKSAESPFATSTGEATESPGSSETNTPSPQLSISPTINGTSDPKPSTEKTHLPDATANSINSAQEENTPQTASTRQPEETPPVGTPTPNTLNRLKEALEPPDDTSNDTPNSALNDSPTSPTPSDNSAMPEADAWLQSLPDSPLLVRRHRGTSQQNGQTW